MTDSLIAGVTDTKIKAALKKSKNFTPSTIGNVVIADTENDVYVVSNTGNIEEFKSSVSKENRRLFLDTLKNYSPDLTGTLHPKQNDVKSHHAQWLSGIAAGAWFEIHDLKHEMEFRFRRISPHGTIDCDGIYCVDSNQFDISFDYEFVHYSNCQFFHIKQNNSLYRFEFLKHYND